MQLWFTNSDSTVLQFHEASQNFVAELRENMKIGYYLLRRFSCLRPNLNE